MQKCTDNNPNSTQNYTFAIVVYKKNHIFDRCVNSSWFIDISLTNYQIYICLKLNYST